MLWSDLTGPEIPAVLTQCGHAAILPVGATEQHGPHLGCGVDFAHPVNRTSLNGVTGSPSLASRKKGQVWFDWLVADLAAVVEQGCREIPPLSQIPPLSHSYFGDDA